MSEHRRLFISIALLYPLLFLPVAASSPIERAASWLKTQEDHNGSIGGFGLTGWATIALIASGFDASRQIAYLESNISKLPNSRATSLERTILAVTAAARDPRNFGGRNLVVELLALRNGGQFGDPALLTDDIFAILALRGAGEPSDSEPIRESASFLYKNQNADGSFAESIGGRGSIDITAATIWSFKAGGDPIPSSALTFLKNAQNPDGGFGFFPGEPSNVDSTSWALLALKAAGEAVDTSFLLHSQRDDGSFGNILSTAYALLALTGRSLPLRILETLPERLATSSPPQAGQSRGQHGSSPSRRRQAEADEPRDQSHGRREEEPRKEQALPMRRAKIRDRQVAEQRPGAEAKSPKPVHRAPVDLPAAVLLARKSGKKSPKRRNIPLPLVGAGLFLASSLLGFFTAAGIDWVRVRRRSTRPDSLELIPLPKLE